MRSRINAIFVVSISFLFFLFLFPFWLSRFNFHSIIYRWASVVDLLRALTLKHSISHRCGSKLAHGTCEMPSFAPVGQVVFLRYSGFRPPARYK